MTMFMTLGRILVWWDLQGRGFLWRERVRVLLKEESVSVAYSRVPGFVFGVEITKFYSILIYKWVRCLYIVHIGCCWVVFC